jgi:hypothetical protein
MKKKRVLQAIVMLAASLGALVVVPSAAQAAYTCGPTQVCLYEGGVVDGRPTGSVHIMSPIGATDILLGQLTFSNQKFTNGDIVANSVKSVVVNNKEDSLYLYADSQWKGDFVFFAKGSGVRDLSEGQTIFTVGKKFDPNRPQAPFVNRADSGLICSLCGGAPRQSS